ncbi:MULTISPECIES: DEAD/DEAH box helicase [unclassified Lentimonas]|uniref:DEAD/DEAH box helicase n=1 Tax=unclassified Lentimonas TaxID=2630993 RepID=UPI0013227380|nr:MULTISPECIES: DEAD/DEAH box helicase [unclassified Lentimonas]CAA6680219.1 ATP-dependent RNA helicase RhlE [Lentimonas sp. CC4]CAA6685572.1 ATP-dependent RNA helicase RhlE [Lentimonas sp. CC6]CAA7077018.1 ATP-dependent RNA helicase RhlE [Lentimonas sp. CC4]CAA7168708.1 ATP-dependent RNA helicase RhlE [Lentimonas sp. CC21]CAA7180734.1 ATP-dependent RNA helicase RhlE [Lentimonas sp. CC8]
MSFSDLDLAPYFFPALAHYQFTQTSPIQRAAIPAILERRDVLGIAKTGSGKTVSYVLPILQHLQQAKALQYREPTVLVLVPTRELADQVCEVFLDFIPCLDEQFKCLAVYGGVSINTQMQAIGRVNVLIATPGRLLDLVEKNAVRLSSIETLVLDEADKILNLGFKDEVDRILALLPVERQNLLFSATLSNDLSQVQQVLLTDPLVCKIEDEVDDIELINQLSYSVSEERKGPLLRHLIQSEYAGQQVLVFVSSKRRADNLVRKLIKNKINAAAVHSKMGQNARRDTLQRFKSGQLPVLVATDLLARGIDIESLPCVINYELPRSPKDYIHRIGRTGRADTSGDAISLITPDDLHHFKVIQKKMGKQVTMIDSADLDLSE